MSDAWEEIQAVKIKRNSLREKLEKRKKERQHILNTSLGCDVKSEGSPSSLKQERGVSSPGSTKDESTSSQTSLPVIQPKKSVPTVSLERRLLQVLSDLQLQLPATAKDLLPGLGDVDDGIVANLLQKFATQKLIVIKERSSIPGTPLSDSSIEVVGAESVRLAAVLAALEEDIAPVSDPGVNRKRRGDDEVDDVSSSKQSKQSTDDKKSLKKEETDIMSLLAMPSSREKAVKRVGEEIMDLLSKPTAKERSLADKFKSQGGAQVMEFCPHGTRAECLRNHNIQKQTPIINSTVIDNASNIQSQMTKDNKEQQAGKEQAGGLTDQLQTDGEDSYLCKKLHFKKIIQVHTDESLGDCSFLNTCFHMDTCKYVHYEVDNSDPNVAANNKISTEPMQKNSHNGSTNTNASSAPGGAVLTLHPPQWVQCDLRYLDMAFLGKFAVIMADPPWDIHMELPYGTMSDDEMRRLGVPQLQDSGLIFLWVTGRAMELGRECLKLWGYARVDELIWVKTNQLQRIIRTGRTGHWLNHGKEHCLVGMKGNPPNLNRGLDCDVIVAEVRATSHKPDEIYGIIERLSPGTRKIELFGRPHNVQPNWITLGNQVDGVRLVDPELIAAFKKRYPDGNCMAPPPEMT